MSVRTVLFIDYQNAYRGAREAFHRPGDPSRLGQLDPAKLGALLVAQGHNRVLAEIRVYWGRPEGALDPVGYRANLRQTTAWESTGVTVITRPLRYPRGWPEVPAMEKGIDVALAVDFVAMALLGEYDVGILFSTDTDLKPALEAVVSLAGTPYPRAEVTAWSFPERRHSPRLSVKGMKLWCHWLGLDDYEAVADRTDFRTPRGRMLAAGSRSRRRR